MVGTLSAVFIVLVPYRYRALLLIFLRGIIRPLRTNKIQNLWGCDGHGEGRHRRLEYTLFPNRGSARVEHVATRRAAYALPGKADLVLTLSEHPCDTSNAARLVARYLRSRGENVEEYCGTSWDGGFSFGGWDENLRL